MSVERDPVGRSTSGGGVSQLVAESAASRVRLDGHDRRLEKMEGKVADHAKELDRIQSRADRQEGLLKGILLVGSVLGSLVAFFNERLMTMIWPKG